MNELHLFAGAGGGSSASTFSDIPASVLSNSRNTAANPYCSDNGMESCHASQYGTTCEPLTVAPGGAASMSSAEDSRARTLAPQEKEQASTEKEAGFGEKWPESFAKWDRVSYSWKTRQFSLLGDLEPFLEIWPRWGSMRNGEYYPRPMPSVRKTDADKGGRGDLIQAVRGNHNKHFSVPTPQARDWKSGKCSEEFFGKNSRPLSEVVHRLPTARTQSKTGGGCGLDGGSGARSMLTEDERKQLTGGSLSPNWVEWLMGWPIGWTDLQPLETDKFRLWWRLHGAFCGNGFTKGPE